jgi:OHCU decarboxylase
MSEARGKIEVICETSNQPVVSLSDEEFLSRYSGLFDHSPWIVERAVLRRPFNDVHAALMQVVVDATEDEQLALIRAHPELAGKAAVDHTLTEASTAEQASAGLDRLTPESSNTFWRSTRHTVRNLDFRSSFAFA